MLKVSDRAEARCLAAENSFLPRKRKFPSNRAYVPFLPNQVIMYDVLDISISTASCSILEPHSRKWY